MGIFDKLLGKRQKKKETKAIQEFVTRAVKGPCYCQIKISEIADLYDALINYPIDALFSLEEKKAADSIGLLRSKSFGVCPKCYTVTNGEWLVHMHLVKGSGMGPALMSKDYARFLIGKCRNPNCNYEEILIFWRPNEDKGMKDLLAKMGIKI
jgi:hypothetical protein